MFRKRYFPIFLHAITIMVIMAGCKNNNSNSSIDDTNVVDIDISHNVIPYSEFIEAIDSVPIIAGDNQFFSSVEDIYVGDSLVFILDAASNLLKVNLNSGRIDRSINLKGHSECECIDPKAITGDGEDIYVLDMQGLKILTLDKNLNCVESVRTPFPSMDIAIIPDGFLLFNINSDDKDDLVGRIDRKGKLKNSFISSGGEPELILTQRIFSEMSEGVIVLPPMQNKLYKYCNVSDSIYCQYQYRFESGDRGSETINIAHDAALQVFETGRYLITNYFADQMIATCVIDKKNQRTMSGLIKTDTQYPFYPMAMKNNTLYGVYDRSLSTENESGHIIVKYSLKN